MPSHALLDTPPQAASAFPAGIDPMRFEVLRNALLAITEEMGATLQLGWRDRTRPYPLLAPGSTGCTMARTLSTKCHSGAFCSSRHSI
jgi:hypothetical protein